VTKPFLTAEWRNVVMLNFAVDAKLLAPLVPAGTELDHWRGLTLVSLVGFLFADTRLLGVPVPWHRTFEEVNLRFYVRRHTPTEVRRAVVFIRELVPRPAVAITARLTYNEPYRALPMRHAFAGRRSDGGPAQVSYGWRAATEWTTLGATVSGDGRVPATESQEAFVTEHYWGYTRQRDGSTIEYEVRHPRWVVWPVQAGALSGDLESVYGAAFASILRGAPLSAFLADGSPVTVFQPNRLAGV
jgi:Uncharacterized conserved protein